LVRRLLLPESALLFSRGSFDGPSRYRSQKEHSGDPEQASQLHSIIEHVPKRARKPPDQHQNGGQQPQEPKDKTDYAGKSGHEPLLLVDLGRLISRRDSDGNNRHGKTLGRASPLHLD